MDRITEKDLKKMLALLNEGRNPDETYNAVGRYDLDFAYGGVKLVQYCAGGGEREISTIGYGTKRELWVFMRGMLSGRTNQ